MKNYSCIPNVLLFTLILALLGCSSQRDFIKELSATDRETISVLRLSIKHELNPTEHALLMSGISSARNPETTWWPMGASRDWSPARHRNVLGDNINKVRKAHSSFFPDESIMQGIFVAPFAGTNRISIVADSKATPADPDGKDARLEITIYHKVGVSVSSYTPSTYVGAVAKIRNSKGAVIYHRRIFSQDWKITDRFLQKEYRSVLERSLRGAAQVFWANITDNPELAEN